MKPSNFVLVAILFVSLIGVFQLRMSNSNSCADWMVQIQSPQNTRLMVQMREVTAQESLKRSIDADIEGIRHENANRSTVVKSMVVENRNNQPAAPSPKTPPEFPLRTHVEHQPIRFHLIMTRYVKGVSILEFNRPAEIYYAMYNYRHRRVLESIFYHHPNAQVTIHTNFMIDSDFSNFIDAGYSLRTAPIEFENLAVGTPMEGATRDPKWKRWELGKHWYTCFSDLYRLLIMWKLGGVYMDTDMIITKPLNDVDKVVAFQDPAHYVINCAMIVFKEPGSVFIWKCMVEVMDHYNGEFWGANGPQLLTRIWREWGDVAERDAVIRALEHPNFYLFYHRNTKHHCFNNSMTGEERLAYAMALAARVPYAVHMSNKMTSTVKKELIPDTFCHYLFTRYCIFCELEPARPPSYPTIDVNGTRIDLP